MDDVGSDFDAEEAAGVGEFDDDGVLGDFGDSGPFGSSPVSAAGAVGGRAVIDGALDEGTIDDAPELDAVVTAGKAAATEVAMDEDVADELG